MTVWQSALLGLVQGFTEFFPVSSSGHLVVFQQLFDIDQPGIIFDVFLHLASLGAIVIYFYKDILKLKFNDLWILAVGSLPAGLVGFFLRSQIELAFSSIRLVALTLGVTGVINLLTNRMLKQDKPAEKTTSKLKNITTALKIGAFQATALIPGISRSGSTIFGGVLTGKSKDEAFSFAFLLAIPAILGASTLEFAELVSSGQFYFPIVYLVGGAAALISGLLSLSVLKTFINKARFDAFGWYCLAISLVLIATQM